MGSAANIWSLVRLGIGALTSKDGQGDKVSGTPGPVGTTKGQETAARYYPWGYDSRSPTGGKRLCVAPVGGSNLVQVGERNDAAKPDYDDEGWTTILHNEVAGTWVKLRKDGGVQIKGNNKTLIEIAADGSIKLGVNGGTEVAVIKNGDAVSPTPDMAAWMNAVGSFAGSPPPPSLANKIGTCSSNSTAVVTRA